MNFPLKTSFTVSHRFLGCCVFIFIFQIIFDFFFDIIDNTWTAKEPRIRKKRNVIVKEKKHENTKGKKNDYERREGKETVRIRNRKTKIAKEEQRNRKNKIYEKEKWKI